MPTNLLFETAQEQDIPAIAALLKSYSLPAEDFGPHLKHFIVVRRNGEVLGCVGLEAEETLGLLRSLAVKREYQNQGIAQDLCSRLEREADALGVHQLFLLTTTADQFFAKRGFEIVNRDDAPAWIRKNGQFTSLCPSSAVLMRKILP
jgi:amino-acid N-acetyltransferase